MKMEKIPSIWLAICGLVYAVGCVVCLIISSAPFLCGFVTGGGLVLVNMWVSARKVKNADFPNRARVLASVVGGFYFRLALLGICLYFLITYLKVDPVGLVTGLSVIPVGMLILLLLIYIANRRPEEA
jgi:MFS family permease